MKIIITSTLLFINTNKKKVSIMRSMLWSLRDREGHRRRSVKKFFVKDFAIFKEKNLCWSLFKETPTQLFSCEYCEILKNSYFEEHLSRAAS